MIILRLMPILLSVVCLMKNLNSHSVPSNNGTLSGSNGLFPQIYNGQLLPQTVYMAERRKKKKPKPGKNKGKKKGKGKSKGMSKGKGTVSLPPSTTTSPTTTTSTPTTSTKTTSPTTTMATTSSKSTAKSSTPLTKSPSTPTTTLPITLEKTTKNSVSSAPGECKTTSGSLCKFPFKDGSEEYNVCANKGGRYFWCATENSWGYCKMDRSCPLEGEENCNGCYANKKPCVFPFKDKKDGKDYNVCKKHGSYFWCATHTDSKGVFTFWEICPKDGSCQLEGQTTLPPITTPTSTTLSKNGTSSPAAHAVADIEKTVKDISTTLQSSTSEQCKSETSDFTENEDKLLQIMADLISYMESNCLKDTATCDAEKLNIFNTELKETVENIKGSNTRSKRNFSYGVYSAFEAKQTVITEITWKVKPTLVTVGDGLGFEPSTVERIKFSIEKKKGCCTDCKEKYPDENVELCEEYKPDKRCHCYKTILGKAPNTWRLGSYSSDICDPCPLGFEHKNGYESIFYKTSLGDYHGVPNIEECKMQCEKLNCFTFAYSKGEKICQLHPTHLKSPSLGVYKDYKLCVREPEGCSECSECSQQKQDSTILKLAPQPPPLVPAIPDYYYAENHGFFIIKLFQEMAIAGGPVVGGAPFVPQMHYVPLPGAAAAAGGHSALVDPAINVVPERNGVYLFFVGPPHQLGMAGFSMDNRRNSDYMWNYISGTSIDERAKINSNLMGYGVRARPVRLLPYYIGETQHLHTRYNQHINLARMEALYFFDRYRNGLPAAHEGNNYYLYFTYAITRTKSQAQILEKLFLDLFDFPLNVRDNIHPGTIPRRRCPKLTLTPMAQMPLFNKYDHLVDNLHSLFFEPIDQTIPFLYPGGVRPVAPAIPAGAARPQQYDDQHGLNL